MKTLCTLLLLHIILLTAFPAMSISSSFSEKKEALKSCCSHKEGKKQGRQPNDCCRYACNPFMSCCNCFALTASSQMVSASVIYFNQKYSIASEDPYANFSSEAWHPPQIG